MYDDMTYLILREMVVKIFNLDLNVRLNLSFNLPSIEMDITDDEDVKFFLECATNSTDGIPHVYVGPPKQTEARIIPGPTEYVRKVNEDDHFTRDPWLQAVMYPHGEGVMASGCLGDIEKYFINGKLEIVVGVVMSCTPNALEDMTVTLKDPTCIMGGTIHYKVFEKNDGYAKSINVRSVMILRNIFVFTPRPSTHYLNITIRNIVKVSDKDTEF
ncbi:reverse transcriptase domain-containing protein [Tanacetum coccineum]